ncbi:MAG: sulfurtransferase, partial [Gaiellaceae bacterium]
MDVEKDEVVRRLGEDGFVILDVRSAGEYRGETTAPCDPRPGRISGAQHLDLQVLLALTADQIRERLGP